jgi:hypothetical protein
MASMPFEHPDEFERRVARAEINRRQVNEAIERGRGERFDGTFVCECGRIACNAKLRLSLDEYEAVRSSFERFLVAPGHEIAGIDEIAEDHDEYLVAVKDGQGGEMAEETDPREDDR